MSYIKDLYLDWLNDRQYDDDYQPTAEELTSFYDFARWQAVQDKLSNSEQTGSTTHHPHGWRRTS